MYKNDYLYDLEFNVIYLGFFYFNFFFFFFFFWGGGLMVSEHFTGPCTRVIDGSKPATQYVWWYVGGGDVPYLVWKFLANSFQYLWQPIPTDWERKNILKDGFELSSRRFCSLWRRLHSEDLHRNQGYTNKGRRWTRCSAWDLSPRPPPTEHRWLHTCTETKWLVRALKGYGMRVNFTNRGTLNPNGMLIRKYRGPRSGRIWSWLPIRILNLCEGNNLLYYKTNFCRPDSILPCKRPDPEEIISDLKHCW